MKYKIILFFLLISFSISAQSIQGQLKNEKGEILPFGSVIVKDIATKSILGFSITNDNGNFEINYKSKSDSVWLTCTMMGYNPLEIKISVNLSSKDLVLTSSDYLLEEVEVSAYKTGVIVNGDTTLYDPSVFTNGMEENLGDILNKLPGINVDEQGKITAKGEDVKKLKVNGDDFMNGKRTVLLDGIDAKDVDKVELVEGVNRKTLDSEVNLDIKLKDNPNSLKLDLGIGIVKKYKGDLNAYGFNDKFNYFAFAKANNTPEQTVSTSDFIELRGGFKSIKQGGLKFPKYFRNANEMSRKNDLALGGNISFNPDKNTNFQVALFGFKGKLNTEIREEQFKDKGDLFLEKKVFQTVDLKSIGSNLVFTKRFKDKYKFELRQYSIYTDEHFSKDNNFVYSDRKSIAQNDSKTLDIASETNMALDYEISKHHSLNAKFGLVFNQNGDDNLFIGQDSFMYFLAGQNVLGKEVNFQLTNKTLESQATVDYRYSKRKWSLSSGVFYSNYTSKFLNYQFGDIYSDDQSIVFGNYGIDIKGAFRFRGVRMKLGTKVMLNTTDLFERKTYFIPKLSLHYNLPRFKHFIKLTYDHNLSGQDLDTYFGVYSMQEPDFLSRELTNYHQYQSKHAVRLMYSFIRPLKGVTFFSMLNYAQIDHKKMRNYHFFSNYQLIDFADNGTSSVQSFFMTFNKKWFDLSLGTNLNINILKNRSDFILVDLLLEGVSRTQIYRFKMYSIWDSWLNIESRYIFTKTKVQSLSDFDANRHEIEANFLGVHLNKQLKWKIGVQYNISDLQENYYLLNGHLNYKKKKSKFGFGLSFRDLLNLSDREIVKVSNVGLFNVLTYSRNLSGYLLVHLTYEL